MIGALLLALLAAMTPFIAEPDRTYAQVLSADATLSDLIVVGGPSGNTVTALAQDDADGGGFVPTEENYEARIGFSDSGVVVTPTATQSSDDNDSANDSIIRVNGTTVTSGSAHNVAVSAGQTTTISIMVKAPQRSVTKTYRVKVYRERVSKSVNADLSSLGIIPGSLTPGFSSGTTDYKARVQADKVTISHDLFDNAGGASAAITATATRGNPSVDGKDVTLGDEASATTITVAVTAENGTAKSYTIEVYRIRANPSIDAALNALALTPDSGSIAGYTFAPATTTYDLTVDNSVEYVTVAPTVADAGAHFVIDPHTDARPVVDGHQVKLRAGVDTTITVTVTAEDPLATKTYTLAIYKRRPFPVTNPDINDATLGSLSLSVGTLTSGFRSSTTSYSAQVASDVDKVTVSYTPTNDLGGVTVTVTVTGTGTSFDSGGKEVTLTAAGATTNISLLVTAEDGTTTETYTIAVYRLRSLPSANATLSNLTLNDETVPGFTAGTLSKHTHSLTVPFATTSATVVATPTQGSQGATFVIMPADADRATTGHQVTLTAGEKMEIAVTVTAEDRVTKVTYTINVYRQRASLSGDATLAALSLSDGMLSPPFMSDRTDYTARVGSDVDKVTVFHTATDDKGGVEYEITTFAVAADGTDATDNTSANLDGMDVTLNAAGSLTRIKVTVTAEDGISTETYIVDVYRKRRTLATDATLSTFMITDAIPADTNNVGTWNLLTEPNPDVGYRVRTVTVTATPTDSLGAVATVTSPPDRDPTTDAHEIDLASGGETMITIEVQAEDPNAPTRTYMAKVHRQGLMRDASLSDLMLSGASLTPAFMSNTIGIHGNCPRYETDHRVRDR